MQRAAYLAAKRNATTVVRPPGKVSTIAWTLKRALTQASTTRSRTQKSRKRRRRGQWGVKGTDKECQYRRQQLGGNSKIHLGKGIGGLVGDANRTNPRNCLNERNYSRRCNLDTQQLSPGQQLTEIWITCPTDAFRRAVKQEVAILPVVPYYDPELLSAPDRWTSVNRSKSRPSTPANVQSSVVLLD